MAQHSDEMSMKVKAGRIIKENKSDEDEVVLARKFQAPFFHSDQEPNKYY